MNIIKDISLSQSQNTVLFGNQAALENKHSIPENGRLSVLNYKAMAVLNKSYIHIDDIFSCNTIRKLLDKFYRTKILPCIESASHFNDWIDQNGHNDWYLQLAEILMKAPLRSVKAVLMQVYYLLKAIIFITTHPIKAMHEAPALLVQYMHTLSQFETYSKMGAGMMGSALMRLQFPCVAIGAALVVTAISLDIIHGSILSETGRTWENIKVILLEKHLKYLPEAFCTGLLFGKIANVAQNALAIKTIDQAVEYVKGYLKKYNLPQPYFNGRNRAHFIDLKNHTYMLSWGTKVPANLPDAFWAWERQHIPTVYFSYLQLPTWKNELTIAAHAATQSILVNSTFLNSCLFPTKPRTNIIELAKR
ncbi:MAG TPA: hypothetical protein VGP47_11705 [Parachlamydiaceae bacterium]|nr:hypothetical protein [Parachlamydiaceae bacterium]